MYLYYDFTNGKSDKVHMYLQAANVDACFMNMKTCIAIFARNTGNSDILRFLHNFNSYKLIIFCFQNLENIPFLPIY